MRPSLVVLALLVVGAGTPRVAHAQAGSHLAAAEELVRALKMTATLQTSTTTMIDVQVRQNPMLAPFRDVMIEWAKRYITAEAVVPEFATIYAATFTEAELKELLKFYRTPLGQKLIDRQSELLQAGTAVGERLGQKHQPELVQMIEARAAELQRDSTKTQ